MHPRLTLSGNRNSWAGVYFQVMAKWSGTTVLGAEQPFSSNTSSTAHTGQR
jgi:hypothetical protein